MKTGNRTQSAKNALRHGLIVLVAVFAIAFQGMAASFARGADVVERDMFGNPLCIGGMDHQRKESGHKGSLPDCCFSGCPMFSGHMPGGPDVSWLIAAPVAPQIRLSSSHKDIDRPIRSGKPRAPPAAA